MAHWPSQTHPIAFRLCCYFPTDLCHLAMDLNFWHPIRVECPGTRHSSQWNEGKMKMKWAELLSWSWSQLCPLLNLITPPPTLPLPSTPPLCIIILLPPPPPPPPPSRHPLGNQCALSFCGTRRHIDLAARTHARGHALAHTHMHTPQDCLSHTHRHTHTYIDLARRSSSIGTAKPPPPFFFNWLALQYTARSSHSLSICLPHTQTHTHTLIQTHSVTLFYTYW